MTQKEYKVPLTIQSHLYERANDFNKKNGVKYVPDARGKFIYLLRLYDGYVERIGRLTYTGDTEKMEFVIFNYHTQKYDSKINLFPGHHHLDGTIEGAMKAGIIAYPL